LGRRSAGLFSEKYIFKEYWVFTPNFVRFKAESPEISGGIRAWQNAGGFHPSRDLGG
jgi:hypothetical protein